MPSRSGSLQFLTALSLALLTPPGSETRADGGFKATARVQLDPDVGQNFGTLFEAFDGRKRRIAGAGFLGCYNTQARSDRRLLHLYVKTSATPAFRPEPLPRVDRDAGTYLFEFAGRLFARSRGGGTSTPRVWDEERRAWRRDEETAPFSVDVAGGVLASTSDGVTYDGRRALTLAPGQGSLAELYYAESFLVFRRHDRDRSPPRNELVACHWTPDGEGAVSVDAGRAQPLGTAREFVYAYGQLRGEVVAATNTGGVYVFDGRAWRTLLEPDVTTSFQIYAMINVRDRLLMGQYPTGELFEYDGRELRHLPGAPPVMPGVRKQAREAQTLTIYAGDLYAGVWPWGEVWRLDLDRDDWEFVGRMFTHPAPTSETTHPYENETKRLGDVLNRWGQRVTSLVPLGDALYISTSAKGPAPYEPRFTFLGDGKWKEYGVVYRWRRPGALCVLTRWKKGATTFELELTGGRLRVRQDGRVLGEVPFAGSTTARPPAKVVWGDGVFGELRGRIERAAWISE